MKGKDNVATDYVIVKVRSVFGSGYSRDVVGRSGSANLKVSMVTTYKTRSVTGRCTSILINVKLYA